VGDLHRVSGPPRPGVTAAAKTSLLLSLLFLVVYGGTNWITSLRSDVGTWHYAWEFAIPFVPLMIVPYMSIDLFFVAAPFLCRSHDELKTLARRIVFAILAAGACFLLLPLRCEYVKPEVDGWIGVVFRTFCGLDQPYNLLPSLHITLTAILVDVYGRKTRGLVRLAVYVWFGLVALSTVLTYQHHVVDVVGGFMLAVACFYLFPEPTPREHGSRNTRVALYYGAGAMAVLALAFLTWPSGGLLLWPMASLAIVAAGYCGLGPGIYRKRDGRLHLSAQLLLAPVRLGQFLSLMHYRRRCSPWNEVLPRVLMGRTLTRAEAASAVCRGVTAVLDLTAEFSRAAPFRATRYRNLPILDLTAPTPAQLGEAVRFIARESASGTVYVHCKVGYSRTAAVVGAYLLATGRAASADEAVAILRKVRPSIIVRPEAMAALRAFAHECRGTKVATAMAAAE
jgi:protein-tyrosine phosphatase/membrane-associated phospholipid phosphatase